MSSQCHESVLLASFWGMEDTQSACIRAECDASSDLGPEQAMRWPALQLAASVAVLVMRIGHMRMPVLDGLVVVPVAVRAVGRLRMVVVVVAVVMRVGMLMVQGPMRMNMVVPFRQVQQHATGHQGTTQAHQPGA